MLFTNPTGNGALIHLELFCGGLLRPKESNKVFKDGVHIAPDYVNTHIVDHRHTTLQRYGFASNNRKMEYKERIKAARRHAGFTQAQLAKLVGIDQASISDLERGRSQRSSYNASIAKACGVSAIWIESGSGPMVSETTEQSNVKDVVQPQMLYRYPVISWVSAGSWEEAVQPYPDGFSDRYEISDYDSKGPAFWLEVKGDSMTAPAGVSVPEGMMILVDTEADVKPGKLVIAKLPASNEATFKKLVEDGGVRYLKPLNPAYKMVECDENCRIIGVAVRMTGKL
ncbi:LexA family protein [Pseudomonas laurylsulfatiphila]|uniref:LexA family protein n=1 Tax=Pseudomonas laurylsulfatiphila TaxID=2011015 RepID=UPI001F0CB5ED|nr:LexA family transcriptional regulator [Pseudomonas laurylsulfatiphila]